MVNISKQKLKGSALLTLIFLNLMVSLFLPNFVQAEESNAPEETSVTQQVRDGVFKGDMDKVEEGGYIEKQFAKMIARVSNFIVDKLGLKDYSELIFQKEDASNPLIYYTFDNKTFDIISTFFNSFLNLSAYLCLFAVVLWGIVIFAQSGTPEAPSALKTMIRGLVIYFCSLYFGGYLFQLIFFANHVLVRFASEGLKLTTGWDATQFSMLEIMANSTESLPDALLFLLVIICVGTLNFQYATRLVSLMFLIVTFPAASYAALIPGNQKTLGVWIKEFNTQVFAQAGHAIAYALFLSLLAVNSSFWLLCAFLVGMTGISNLIRIIFGGESGGRVGNALGAGSMLAMAGLMKGGKMGLGGGAPSPKMDSAPKTSNPISFGSLAASALPKLSPSLSKTSSSPSMQPTPSLGSSASSGGMGSMMPSNTGQSHSLTNLGSKLRSGATDSKAARLPIENSQSDTGLQSNTSANNGSSDPVPGNMRPATKLALNAAKVGAKAAVQGVAAGVGYIAGTAATGNVAGGLMGAKMGLSGVNMGLKAAQAGKSAYDQFKSNRQENPIQPASVSPQAAQLALPMGSSAPMLALPAGPERALGGPIHEPLANDGGVLVSQTPGYTPSNHQMPEFTSTGVELGPTPFMDGLNLQTTGTAQEPGPAPTPFMSGVNLQTSPSQKNNVEQAAQPTPPASPTEAFELPSFLKPRQSTSSSSQTASSGMPTPTQPSSSPSIPTSRVQSGRANTVRESSSTPAGASGPTRHASQVSRPQASTQGPTSPQGIKSPPNGLSGMTSKPEAIQIAAQVKPIDSKPNA